MGRRLMAEFGQMEKKRDQTRKFRSEEHVKEIQAAAYYRFLKRGGKSGNDLGDWLEAEKEVKRRYETV